MNKNNVSGDNDVVGVILALLWIIPHLEHRFSLEFYEISYSFHLGPILEGQEIITCWFTAVWKEKLIVLKHLESVKCYKHDSYINSQDCYVCLHILTSYNFSHTSIGEGYFILYSRKMMVWEEPVYCWGLIHTKKIIIQKLSHQIMTLWS